VIAENEGVAKSFFKAVCEWCGEVRGEILVFSDGHWSKSADLFESIQNTTLESLILTGGLKNEIANDFAQFFQGNETYVRYGIPWKRGILFLGPPGNGKTHAVKGLINLLQKPCLYVRSFKTEYQTDQHNIAAAFKRARESAPCLFVLEDLDSLIDDENRSYFLNELDGFYANEGILTIATSNHPERLDPAILDRPSRFDRKYAFDLPGLEERGQYLHMFSSRLDPELRLSAEGVEAISAATEEFSFAYLKELFLSAMMQWVAAPGTKPMDQIMVAQVKNLCEQMRTGQEMSENVVLDGEDAVLGQMPAMAREYAKQMRARMARRRR